MLPARQQQQKVKRMVVRKILHINEEECTGCGQCIPACAEGAIQIVDGKAKLIRDKYCDGLGACVGDCPEGAISIQEREAEEYDEEAVQIHLGETRKTNEILQSPAAVPSHQSQQCPSTTTMQFERTGTLRPKSDSENSKLSHWPVQLALVPTNAQFFEEADLAITADCVPFAYANFHKDFLKDRILVVGCAKLDDAQYYQKKLVEIFRNNRIKSVTVINMEVPCCFGLYNLVKQALNSSGKDIPLKQHTISIKGNLVARTTG